MPHPNTSLRPLLLCAVIAACAAACDQPPPAIDPDATRTRDAADSAAPPPDAQPDREPPAPDAAIPRVQDETCNGLDDDLDGVADEVESVWCSSDEGEMRELRGVCRPGQRRCVNGAWGACEGEVGPQAEQCNQLDDDCDGEVDEGFDLSSDPENCGVCGEQCDRPNTVAECIDGACVGPCADGFNDCNGDPTDGCEQIGKCPLDATCDGVDDDEDGRVDEGYRPVFVCGVGLCAETARESRCEDGQEILCEPGEPLGDDTLCNGRDEDCDGRIDEGFEPEGCGVGFCAGDAEPSACEDGRFMPCQPDAPAPEACNEVDDDCDGAVDEGFDPQRDLQHCGGCGQLCRPAAASAICDEGVCRILECLDGFSDCNGDVADGCETAGPCPADSNCDGEDDDFDGSVDEGYVPVTACGLGLCDENAAPSQCEDAVETPCRPGAPEPDDRLCDGRDQDCDGRLDEDYQPQTCGVGACMANAVLSACTDGRDVLCRPGAPVVETCNGADDDCDGAADEGFPLGEPCDAGIGACRDDGRWFCAADGGLDCSAVPHLPIDVDDHICDGRDGDCDGATDEGFVPMPCGAGRCLETSAPSQCVDGAVVACVPGVPSDDVCNDEDDDCDGEVDEDFPVLEACSVGVGECRDDGRFLCADDGDVACTAVERQPVDVDDRICDGRDGDCDGQVDEGFVPELCGQGACRVASSPSRCDSGDVVACAPGAPEAEACNGRDDDCDGAVDESYQVGEPCLMGEGACEVVGEWVCAADGSVVCDAQAGEPSDEEAVCNRLDDDCDGRVDEGAGIQIIDLLIPDPGRYRFVRGYARPGGGWWLLTRHAPDQEVDLLIYDANGSLEGEPIRLTDGTAELRYRFDAAVVGDGLEFCWHELDAAATSFLHCGAWYPATGPIAGSTVRGTYHSLAEVGGHAVVATVEPFSQFVYLRSIREGVLGPRVLVGDARRINTLPDVDWSGSRWFFTYRAYDDRNRVRLYARFLEPDGRPATDNVHAAELAPSGTFRSSSSAGNNRGLAVWERADQPGIQATLFDAQGEVIGGDLAITDEGIEPVVVRSGGAFRVFWTVLVDGVVTESQARTVSAEGELGDIIRLPVGLGPRAGSENTRRFSVAGDDLLVSWTESGESPELRAQLVRGGKACADSARCEEGAIAGTDPCNGHDDDCDGSIDEGFASVDCGAAICGGQTHCVSGVVRCDAVWPDENDECIAP